MCEKEERTTEGKKLAGNQVREVARGPNDIGPLKSMATVLNFIPNMKKPQKIMIRGVEMS